MNVSHPHFTIKFLTQTTATNQILPLHLFIFLRHALHLPLTPQSCCLSPVPLYHCSPLAPYLHIRKHLPHLIPTNQSTSPHPFSFSYFLLHTLCLVFTSQSCPRSPVPLYCCNPIALRLYIYYIYPRFLSLARTP